jgi:hypothetical protein
MYKATIYYEKEGNTKEEDISNLINGNTDIKIIENVLINYLKENGKESGFEDAVICVDSLNDKKIGNAYIYLAQNINTDKPTLKTAYHLLNQEGEKSIIIESGYDHDGTRYNKKSMRINRNVSLFSFVGILFMIQRVYDSLKVTHSIKSFDFLFNSAILAIFIAVNAIGMTSVFDEAMNYFIDKKNAKIDKSLMLIKE